MKNNVNITKFLAFNLIEMVVTMSIIAILAGITISNFAQLKSPQEILDDTTSIIVSTINEVATNSIVGNTVICNMIPGTGNTRATCNNTIDTWNNINNTAFNGRARVRFFETNGATPIPIATINYTEGFISGIRLNNSATIISDETRFNPIRIFITINNVANLCNIIQLWSNNVTTVNRNATVCIPT